MSTWDALIDALAGIPRLQGARCKSNPSLWESDDPADVAAAERTCLGCCPELARCEAYWRSLKPSQRPTGCVIAGAWRPPHRPRTRKAHDD
jgi:hypothetical protein